MLEREEEYKELFQIFSRLSNLYPDMRFGQLVCMLSRWVKGTEKSAVYDVTNSELLIAAKEHLKKNGNL